MNMLELIEKKRDAKVLTRAEIDFFLQGYLRDEIPDYQVSALLMAIYLNSMTKQETADLAMAMAESGETMDYTGVSGVKIDKHSSGGVGDKTTLILGAMVSACGLMVTKMSGRSLGFTGGTIDKLESITGFRTSLSQGEFIQFANQTGLVIIGQTANIAPADKKLYALRDVTGTVASMPLIASSIMSKKLAANSDGIVLDVKTGSGAFMKTLPESVELAQEMVSIGTHANKKTIGVITSMDQPLGYAVGNALEVKEAIATLHGEGPADLTELSLVLGAEMLLLGGVYTDKQQARIRLEEVLADGQAFGKFYQMVEQQGGDVSQIINPQTLPQSKIEVCVVAQQEGYVSRIDAQAVGESSLLSGAGRLTKTDVIDMGAGILLEHKVGDWVNKGDLLCTVYSSSEQKAQMAVEKLEEAFVISQTAQAPQLIQAIVRDNEVEYFE